MADWVDEPDTRADNEQLDAEALELSDRRDFLRSLGKWSTAAIAAILVIEPSPSNDAAGWVNRRGSWVNGDKSRRWRMAQQPRGRRQLG